MENTPYSSIIGNSAAPYVNSLATQGAIAGNYFALDHPSLPNYMELTSGQSYSWAPSDCDAGPGCETNATNIADRLEASGKTWREYAESMGSPCQLSSSGSYYARHNPFVYFTGITGNATRCNSHVVDFSNMTADLASASSTPTYAFITPNGCSDMHDCSVQTGDTWLSQHVPAILASPAFTTQHSLLVLVWDEDDGTQGNQVAFVAVGYGVKTAYTSSVAYDHYSFLKTVEASWGLATLTSNDASASPMTDIFGSSAPPPPPLLASASASVTSGTAPLAVNFTGTASGGRSPYSYSWSFGDGGTSTSQNPGHTYSSAGSYTVHLTVTDANSATAAAAALTITASSEPLPLSASATASPAAGDAPLPVAFAGSAAGGTSPYSYSWAFGDGATASTQNATHTYSAAGAYTATVTVTDASSRTASATAAVVVSPALVAAASASPTSGDAPLAVAFTGSATGGLAPITFAWDFGDGVSSTSISPSHTYTAAGSYIARLTARDANAKTSAATVSISVTPGLTATPSASPRVGDAPLVVAFTGSNTGGLAPFTYSWTFGDGASSTTQSPSHTYTAAAQYTAQLTVRDAAGRSSSATVAITVNPLPTATATAAPTRGDAPVTVVFTGGTTGGTAPNTYAWGFGDGGTSTAANPSHAYATPGTYTAVFTVTDATGHGASASVTVTVNPKPAASAAASPTAGNVPLTVSFTGSATGGFTPYGYAWSFGDGASSTAQSPGHTYTVAGSYQATLTVTDAVGVNVTATTATITITGPLVSAAHAQPLAGDAPVTVSFNGSATGGTSPYAFGWSFGDGAASATQNPSHTYTAAGTYTATLTVRDAVAAVSSSTVTVVVSPALSASSSATPLSGEAPLAVAFTGTTSGGLGSFTYAWTFGDGVSSTAQNPGHTYGTAGTYTAVLTVTDANQAKSTATALTIVVRSAPTVTATVSPAVGDVPLPVTFNTAVAAGTAPFTYAWSFGDGGSGTTANPTHTYGTVGVFTAQVTVTDAAGHIVSSTARVTVNPALSGTAVANPTAGDGPLAVRFTGSASAGTSPYTFSWTFGDGATSTSQSPTHTYAAGTYSAQLTVSDAAGRSVTPTLLSITVYPALTVTASVAPTVGVTPVEAAFTGTVGGGIGPFTYAWVFGDGSTASTQNATHTYTGLGTYSTQLTVTDGTGATATALAGTVTVNGPLAATAAGTPLTGDAPMMVKLTGSGAGGVPPYSYAWDLGDGTTNAQADPTHVYSSRGTYTATLTLTDSKGTTSHASFQVTVYDPLRVTSSVTPTSGGAPLSVTFTGTASGGLPPYQFTWQFGDGSSGSGATATHAYAGGSFNATLTVRDAAGGGWTGAAANVTATAAPAPSPTTGGGAAAPAPPSTTSPSQPTTAPSAPASAEPSEPVETQPTPAAANNQPEAPGSPGGLGVLLLVIGSLLGTGLGGAVFLAWRNGRVGR